MPILQTNIAQIIGYDIDMKIVMSKSDRTGIKIRKDIAKPSRILIKIDIILSFGVVCTYKKFFLFSSIICPSKTGAPVSG